MSRIGKDPITVPSDVTITLGSDNKVTVKGPKGELFERVDPEIIVELSDGICEVKRPSEQKRHKAMHGLYRSLINNMVVGVSTGYEKNMEVVGVGYKADAKGQMLELNLDFHPIMFLIPPDLNIETETKKGFPPAIKLTGADKQLLGQVAAKIRALRPPEPYKGKGIRFKGEQVRRKAGKAAAKA